MARKTHQPWRPLSVLIRGRFTACCARLRASEYLLNDSRSPLAQTLRSDIPGSLRDLALLYGDGWVWDTYGRTLYSVITGLPAFDLVHGQTLFEYLHLHPQAAATFDQGMTAYSEQEAAAVLAASDFSHVSKVVDVGGGQGALLAAILNAYPHTGGVLFDQSSVIDRARNVMARAGGRPYLCAGSARHRSR
jgi:phytoene dehydrogenase-like protein